VWNDESQADTNRLKAIHKFAWSGYLFTQPDSAFYFAQLEYDFAKSKGLKKQMANALNTQGLSFYIRGDYVNSIDFHTLSLTIREEISDKKGTANSLNNIGIIYRAQGNYATAIEYHTRSLAIKEEIGDKNGIANSLNNIGIIYDDQGDYASAIDYHTRSLTIKEEFGDKKRIANSLNNIGLIHKNQGNYANAIDYHTRSLTIYEEMGDKKRIATSLNNIGIIYMNQSDYASAIDYYTRSLALQEEMGDKQGVAASLTNIGSIYNEQGNYASAIDYNTRSLTIHEEMGDKRGVTFCLNSIGNIYSKQGDYTSAMDYHIRSLNIREEIGDKEGIATSLTSIGSIYNAQGEFAKAIAYNTRALTIAQEVGAALETRGAANMLYEAYKAIGRHKPALEMYELYITMRDSIDSEENQKEVIRQEYKYAYEKEALADSLVFAKKEAIKDWQLKKSDNIKLFFIFASILTLLLDGFAYYAYRQKRKANAFLRESKERAISLFGQQVSKEVAAELLSKSFTSNSKKLLACIMFIDIRGFTPFSENKEPSEIISRHNGIINQFLGDGFMATFGAPSSSGNDSQNAVDAAGEIIALLKKKCESGEIPQTKVGIGLHTGDIVTGNVGTAERKQYSITGNTVILASRIEQLNKQFNSEILISKEVLDKLDHNPSNSENLGAVDLKGRAEPIEIVRLN